VGTVGGFTMFKPSRRTALKLGATIVGATVLGLDAQPAQASEPSAGAVDAGTRASFAAARGKVFRASGTAGTYRLTLRHVDDLVPAKCANDPDSYNLVFDHVDAGPPEGIYTLVCSEVPTSVFFLSPIGSQRRGSYTQALINRQA
jgi:hypothetical protein